MGAALLERACRNALKELCASRDFLVASQSWIALMRACGRAGWTAVEPAFACPSRVRGRPGAYWPGLESPRVAAAIRAPIWSEESTTWLNMCSGPAPGRTAVAIWLAAVWAMARAVFSAVFRPGLATRRAWASG